MVVAPAAAMVFNSRGHAPEAAADAAEAAEAAGHGHARAGGAHDATRLYRVAADAAAGVSGISTGPIIGLALIVVAVLVMLGGFLMAEFAGDDDVHSDPRKVRKFSTPPGYVPPTRSIDQVQASGGQGTSARKPPPTVQPRFPNQAPPSSVGSRVNSPEMPGSLPPATFPLDGAPTRERMSMGTSVGVAPPRSGNNVPPVMLPGSALSSAGQLNAPPQPTSIPTGRPTPLCKELVLPHCEAWFAIAFKDLEQSSGSFDFFGLSGKALLRAQIQQDAGGGGSVSICMKPSKSPTLGKLTLQASGSGKPNHMQVSGKSGHYGEYRSTGPMQFSMICNTPEGLKEVLKLNFDESTSQLILAAAAGGEQLACASRCVQSEFFTNVEHLEVRVNPGVDAVLALLCVIGAVVFGSNHGGDLPVGAPPPHLAAS